MTAPKKEKANPIDSIPPIAERMPNKWNMLSEIDLLREHYKVMTMDKVPKGLRNLDTAIKLSRKVHKGRISFENAKKKLFELQGDEAKFRWQPFSKQQLDYIDAVLKGEYWIYMAEGAVRSGKTICATAAWLKFLQKSDFPRHLLTGKTKDTLFRNILSDVFDILGEGNYLYNKAEGILQFMDKTVWCLGANDERSETRFRGPTVGSWYADEVTTYPESVMKMAISRPSVEGAKIMWTTNPDTPYHPVHKEYVANEKLHEEKTIIVMKFLLQDNLTLPKDYIKNLKATYSGVWYDRFIKGLWTVAEGAIFDMFMEAEHTFDEDKPPRKEYTQYVVGVDYGTATVCTFELAGVFYDDKGQPHFHFLDEYYYDVGTERHIRTDLQHAQEMERFIQKYPVTRIFCPHDATSFTAQLLQMGMPATIVAPDVIDSIRRIQSMLSDKPARFKVSTKCDNLIKQYQTCVWDAKAQAMGIDKPQKPADDHAMDASRYLTAGQWIAGACPDPRLVVGGKPFI